jgi:hypothetical protein
LCIFPLKDEREWAREREREKEIDRERMINLFTLKKEKSQAWQMPP